MARLMLKTFWIQFVAIFAALTPAQSATQEELWSALRNGTAFAIMRHALAPGTGDPSQFKLRDCATQRNLSQAGRDQAVRIGNRFRKNGIKTAQVYSSQWCRCLETARLLKLGKVNELPALNSFFQNFERRDSQTDELRNWLSTNRTAGTLVLSTHQVNISALTGQFTSSGEVVVARIKSDGSVAVLGSIEN